MKRAKKILVALVLLAAIVCVPTVTKAAGHSIRSHGTLIIKNKDNTKQVELYASDIQYLQDELDKLFSELPGGASVMSLRDTPTVSTYSAPAGSTQQDPVESETNEVIVTE